MKHIKKMPTPNLQQALTAKLLGAAVKARRTQSQLKLEAAAQLCGVAKDTLMKIEHGNASCRLRSILQVCDGLGINICINPWVSSEDLNDWQ